MYGVKSSVAKHYLFWIVIAVLSLIPQATRAEDGAGTFSLSPSLDTYVSGSTFTVAIREDSGLTAVNAVQADLAYDPSSLEFVAIDSSSSAFDIKALQAGGNGNVTIARAKLGNPLTGNQLIGSITFKVIGNSGFTSIKFLPSSSLLSASSNKTIWNGNDAAGTYTLLATGQITHSSPRQSSNEAENLVAIKVVNSANEPVVGAKVTLDGTTRSTDPTGTASFHNIPSGNRKLAVVTNHQTESNTLKVDAKPAGGIQVHEVQLVGAKYNSDTLWYVALLILAILFAVIWLSKQKHHRNKSATNHTNHKDVIK